VLLSSEERERTLPFGTRLTLGMHRCLCKWCARYARQIAFIHDAVSRLSTKAENDPARRMPVAMNERMKAVLRGREE
jgi:hypothetical protein